MIRSFKTKTVALATVGALTLGGGAYAAVSSSSAPTPLTGSITDKASTAALAKVPGGTLVGIQSRTDGTFEAEVRKTDGTDVEVELDKDFKVTGTHAGGFGRHGGGRGGFGRGEDVAALAKALGVTEAKLQAALEATHGAKDAEHGDQAAAIAKALDASTADVQAVFDAQDSGRGPRGGGGGGGRGEDSTLVTALAKKTGKSESAVRSALTAAHTAREDAEAAALAKELGLDTAKVKTALAAEKPGRP